jgi:hypothetical protein
VKLVEISDEAHKAAKQMAARSEIPMNQLISQILISQFDKMNKDESVGEWVPDWGAS